MFKLQKIDNELRKDSLVKRLENIQFIENIPREKLLYSQNENRLTLFNYTLIENLTIQYPGKESTNKKMPKLWDFRPKLENDKNFIPDLSFSDIWIELYKIYKNLDKKISQHIMKLIACEFYRMAYLIDYIEVSNTEFNVENLQSNLISTYNSSYKIHIYTPNCYIINELNKVYPKILGFSWESFFGYIDLIALNEDCKYYYTRLHKIKSDKNSDKNPEEEAKKYINSGVGRRNNLFTHIEFIRFMITEPTFIDMIQKFVNGRGVAPISQYKLNEFLIDYIS